MKRNGRNMKMPKDGIITSDLWSKMKNQDRYDYLKDKIHISTLNFKYSKQPTDESL